MTAPFFYDKITISRLGFLHPIVCKKAIELFELAWSKGLLFRASQGLRTPAEQHSLYRQGRETIGKIVTNSDAWQSYHNYGLAFDVVLLDRGGQCIWDVKADQNKNKEPDLLEFANLAKSLGFKWGGYFKTFIDRPHFEMTFGIKTAYLKKMALQGKLNEVLKCA